MELHSFTIKRSVDRRLILCHIFRFYLDRGDHAQKAHACQPYCHFHGVSRGPGREHHSRVLSPKPFLGPVPACWTGRSWYFCGKWQGIHQFQGLRCGSTGNRSVEQTFCWWNMFPWIAHRNLVKRSRKIRFRIFFDLIRKERSCSALQNPWRRHEGRLPKVVKLELIHENKATWFIWTA